MVQLVNPPPPVASGRTVPRRPVDADRLGPPPEILPPERRSRLIVSGALVFLGVLLVLVTIASGLASNGVFAVVILVTAAAGVFVLWRRPGARRTRLRSADPEQIGAVGGRFHHDLRR